MRPNGKTNAEMKKTVLLETLKSIPKLQRDVFILKTLQKQSTEYICTTLEITEKEFWICIHMIRQHLIGDMSNASKALTGTTAQEASETVNLIAQNTLEFSY